jgi:hypothetical protein
MRENRAHNYRNIAKKVGYKKLRHMNSVNIITISTGPNGDYM